MHKIVLDLLMVRFEEEVVGRWYNLQGYLTALNIPFESPVKRSGGKGRGEIDVLALKLDTNGKIVEGIHTEVSVSVTSRFPWIEKGSTGDDANRMLKKFFSKGAENKIREYFGCTRYKNRLISSEFSSNAVNKLRNRFQQIPNSSLIDIVGSKSKITLSIYNVPKDWDIEVPCTKTIEIIPFSNIINDLKIIFKEQKLSEKDFADVVMRSIQCMFIKEK